MAMDPTADMNDDTVDVNHILIGALECQVLFLCVLCVFFQN